ncbi:MAG: hypothetical protein WC600_14795 [Desulfobaccales bacterium]
MKKLIIFASSCLFLVVCLASFSLSAPIPDLKGVWKGTATVGWVRADGSTPLTQKFMDYDITITITDQNQDLVLGKMDAQLIGGPPAGPVPSADFAGVIYGDNELHFLGGDPTGVIGFGKLSLSPLKPSFGQKQTISGHWIGSLGPSIPFHGTAARFSVTKRTLIKPPTPGGPAKEPLSK